jgi:hypothetical protein
MKNLPTYLWYLGIICAAIAVVMAFASLESRASATNQMHPEAAIAIAIAAFVFLRASEKRGG